MNTQQSATVDEALATLAAEQAELAQLRADIERRMIQGEPVAEAELLEAAGRDGAPALEALRARVELQLELAARLGRASELGDAMEREHTAAFGYASFRHLTKPAAVAKLEAEERKLSGERHEANKATLKLRELFRGLPAELSAAVLSEYQELARAGGELGVAADRLLSEKRRPNRPAEVKRLTGVMARCKRTFNEARAAYVASLEAARSKVLKSAS